MQEEMATKRLVIKNSLRIVLIIWSLILTSLMSGGFMSKAHIGSITWGPTTDIWAMSIAISKINYGLKGGLGYIAVSDALAKYLTSTGDAVRVFDKVTQKLVDEPKIINQALMNAIKIPSSHVQPGPLTFLNYVTTYAEDIGFVDFYETAFRIFGFDAYSTHYLYFSILFMSIFLYIAAFYKNDHAVIILALAISSLFLMSTADIFSISVPTFATNRFLSTLAIVSMLHIMQYAFNLDRFSKKAFLYLLLQTLLFAFTIRLRSSATWMVISVMAVLLMMLFINFFYKKVKHMELLTPKWLRHMVTTVLLMLVIIIGYSTLRYASLHSVYRSDDIMPSHLVWHSAYIALSLHPNWPQKLPYPELEGLNGDAIPFKIHDMKFKSDPTHYYVSPISNGYRVRVHERLIRQEFISFAKANPVYMLQLYFYYKPYETFIMIRDMMHSIPLKAWLFNMIGFISLSILSIMSLSRHQAILTLCVMTIIWALSFLPIIWAYPGPYLVCDQIWGTLMMGTMLLVMILPMIRKNNAIKKK